MAARRKYTHTFVLASLGIALILSSLPVFASEEKLCQNLFSNFSETRPLPVGRYVGGYRVTPDIFEYLSNDGVTRSYELGRILEVVNNRWEVVGTGELRNGVIVENLFGAGANTARQNQVIRAGDRYLARQTAVQGPDLRPLRSFDQPVTQFFEQSYYPNIGGYYPSVVRRIFVGAHHIDIIIPQGSGYESYAEAIASVILELPRSQIEALHRVRINKRSNKNDDYWRHVYKGFTSSAATAGKGEMDIYGSALSEFVWRSSEALRIARHEFGHLIAHKLFWSADPSASYIQRAQRDPNIPSEYARNSWAEDFAEAIEVYLRTNAGQLDPYLRQQLANRFSFLDDVFSGRHPQSVEARQARAERARLQIKVTMVGPNELLALAPELGVGLLLKLD